MSCNHRAKPHATIDSLEKGDVVLLGRGKGRLRKVRRVHRCSVCNRVSSVTVLKLVRSRYCGPTTDYLRCEMYYLLRGVLWKSSLCTVVLECAVQADIDAGRCGVAARIRQNETVGILI